MKQSVPDSVYFAMAGQNIEKETKSHGKNRLYSSVCPGYHCFFHDLRTWGQEQTLANDITADPTSS